MNSRFLHVLLVVGGTGAFVAASCGGTIVSGYLDDAGSLHAPDGAVVFGAGTHCVGFDASAISKLDAAVAWNPSPPIGGSCDADTSCGDLIPPGAPLMASICQAVGTEDAATCRVGDQPLNLKAPQVPMCTPGVDGDRYCGAYFQQFVAAPGARAVARCASCMDVVVGPADDSPCTPNAGYFCVSDCPSATTYAQGALLGHLSVERNGGPPGCEVPCQP